MRQEHLQFNVLLFGLCNALETVKDFIETVLRGLSFEASLMYLGNIVIVMGTFKAKLEKHPEVARKGESG